MGWESFVRRAISPTLFGPSRRTSRISSRDRSARPRNSFALIRTEPLLESISICLYYSGVKFQPVGWDRGGRETFLRRALHIEWFLIAYNLLEGVLAVTLGILAGSIALVGFGLDSAIEVSAAGILVWRLRLELRGENPEKAELRAHRFVGITFLLLTAYVGFESIHKLAGATAPEKSLPGMVLAAASLVVMPALGWAKLGLARRLGSRALRADGMETIVCAWLSFTLLLGLGANALCGWWWADPVAALAMVPLMLKEGWEGIRGEECSAQDKNAREGL